MKRVAVPVPDLRNADVDGVMNVLKEMGFTNIGWMEKAAPTKPNAGMNIEQLRKYGVQFTDIRRFELEVPEEMSLEWVSRLVKHALGHAEINADVGKPLTLG